LFLNASLDALEGVVLYYTH